MTTKGFAQYELIRAAAIEDTIVESESNISIDITWNTVDKILQPPPLTAAATLVRQGAQTLSTAYIVNNVKNRKSVWLLPFVFIIYMI